MAHYKRLALAGHAGAARAAPRPRSQRSRIKLPSIRREVDPHDAQPMLGMVIALPLGLACWGAIAGAALLIAELVG